MWQHLATESSSLGLSKCHEDNHKDICIPSRVPTFIQDKERRTVKVHIFIVKHVRSVISFNVGSKNPFGFDADNEKNTVNAYRVHLTEYMQWNQYFENDSQLCSSNYDSKSEHEMAELYGSITLVDESYPAVSMTNVC